MRNMFKLLCGGIFGFARDTCRSKMVVFILRINRVALIVAVDEFISSVAVFEIFLSVAIAAL